MPKRASSSRRATQPVDHKLVVAISLQEASTYLHQAELALEKIEDTDRQTSEIAFLQKVQSNLVRIHNRYSRVKMS